MRRRFTEAQLLAWITPLLWPFLRVLALFSALPVLGQRAVPMRVRVALAVLVALAAQASLPPMPPVALDSPLAFMLVLQQVVIGISAGLRGAHRVRRGRAGRRSRSACRWA